MQLPKSSHDLGAGLTTVRRNSRRESNASKHFRQMKDWQFKITNPFRDGQQQNCIPRPILNQIQQLEYISSKSIKNIQIPQCRRPSNFVKNLQIMQQLAKLQQQKYSGMLRGESNNKNNGGLYQNQPNGISFSQQDDISLQLNGFYDYQQRIEDDFNLFENNNNSNEYIDEEQPVTFYSSKQLEQYQMDEQVNNYLG